MAEDIKKPDRPWATKYEEPKTKEEAQKMVDSLFKEAEDYTKLVPKEVLEVYDDRLQAFLRGELSWADILGLPMEWRKQVVEMGYEFFKQGRYKEAERFFKILTIMDWKNPYYHTMLGQVMQREKLYVDALTCYALALEHDPKNIICLVSSGECYMSANVYKEARGYLEKAIKLTDEKSDWGQRARTLLGHLESMMQKAAPVKKAVPAGRQAKGKKK